MRYGWSVLSFAFVLLVACRTPSKPDPPDAGLCLGCISQGICVDESIAASSKTTCGLGGVRCGECAANQQCVDGGCITNLENAHWCSENPLAERTLIGVWASATEVWAVAGKVEGVDQWGRRIEANREVLQWSGTTWVTRHTATAPLAAIWGSSPADIWAVGASILHWDGVTWSSFQTFHWDGAGWVENPGIDPLSLTAIHGSSATDVWAVGSSSQIFHWDGVRWGLVPAPPGADLKAVWSRSAREAWAVGDFRSGGPSLFLLDPDAPAPGNWIVMPVQPPVPFVKDIWASGSGDLWVLAATGAARWNGSAWTLHSLPDVGWVALWGASSSDLWAIGPKGIAARWNGAAWVTTALGDSSDVRSIWGNSASDIWAVGARGVTQHWDGSMWTVRTRHVTADLQGLWGPSADELWAVGSSGTIVRRRNGVWETTQSNTVATLKSVWGTGPTDVWAVGTGATILHWDGTSWSRVASGASQDLFDVWASSATDVWVFGEGGIILRWNGAEWNALASDAGTLLAVHGTGPDDVWAAGRRVVHWDGATLSVKSKPPFTVGTLEIHGLWAQPNSHVTAVGFYSNNSASARREDGVEISWLDSADRIDLEGSRSVIPNLVYADAVWASSSGDVWVAGSANRWLAPNNVFYSDLSVAHLTRTRTQSMSTGVFEPLSAIWGSSAADVWAVGSAGTIVRLCY